MGLEEELLRWFKERGIAESYQISPPPTPRPPPPPPLPPRPPSAPPGAGLCCGEYYSCPDPPYECLTWDEYYNRDRDDDYSYSDRSSDDDSRYLHQYRSDVGFVQPIASADSDDSDSNYRWAGRANSNPNPNLNPTFDPKSEP